MKIYDVIIIGGGLSGIKAFIDLKKNGLNVLLLEKSTYLGGRAFSFKTLLPSTNIEYYLLKGCCSILTGGRL